MRFLFLTILLAIFSLTTITKSDDTKKNDSVFVPTKEWQKVRKGTPLPAGLHIKHNFQTGETEAKLMDEKETEKKTDKKLNDSQKNSLTLHPDNPLTDKNNLLKKEELPSDDLKLSFDELKAMLKKIKSDEADSLLNTKSVDEQAQPEKRKKLRSYSEIKEELEALNMNVTTDSEVLTSLFSQFGEYKEAITSENLDSSMVEDILEILNNMEYLIHQIDNAQMFADLEGMTKMISPSLNSTNFEIKAEALKLLGAAAQSNPKVQLKALENDFVQKILHMLSINNKIEVKSRCLFALGALVRHFPAAQKTLVNNGGFEIFGKILADGPSAIQVRVMNLINDLAIERQNLKEIQDEQLRLKRALEYDVTDFEEKLRKQKYCQNLVDLASRSLELSIEIDDFHEIVYESLVTLGSICKYELVNQNNLLPLIDKKLIMYRDSPKINEDGENLSLHLLELVEKIKKIISSSNHDEL